MKFNYHGQLFLGFALILSIKRRNFFPNHAMVASSPKMPIWQIMINFQFEQYHTDIWNLHEASQNSKAKPYPFPYILWNP